MKLSDPLMQPFSLANPVSLPVVQPSAARVTRTHCPYCAFQCGMTITTSGEAELQICPDEHFPVNQGQMCIKGFTSGELVRHPARLTTPLVRGADGRLVSATWEAALDLVAERLLRLKADHGPEALAAFGSGSLTNEKVYLLGKFVRLALGSPYVDYNGRYCMASAAAGQNLAFGIDRGLPFPVSHIAQARTVLLWGSNLADTLPPIMQYFNRQRQNDGRLIVVDPRLTDTARAAHIHLQLTPGSDLALANGLLHLVIEEKLIDEAYIEQRTSGFEAVRCAVSTYHPARVERLTGVSAEKMRRAVRLLAAESSMLLSGRGPEQQSKGTDTVLAFTNLMLALGKVGKPFSGYGCLTGQGNGQGGREHGQKADQLPGYRLIEREEHRREVAAHWKINPATLPRKGKSATELIDCFGAERGVRALLVFGSNLAVAAPGSHGVAEKLARLDLLVVCDSFLNETCERAHVVLPTMQWCEEEGTMTNLEGRVILRRRAVAPPDGARSDIEILRQLARRLGRGELFEFERARDVFEELRRVTAGAPADYNGISYERIEKNDGVFWPCPSEHHPGTPVLFTDRFAHPDGRARFVAVEYRPAGEEPDADYPIYFTTGRLKEQYNSGAQTRLVAPLLEARPEPRVQMHPRLALRHGLSDGDYVTIESRRGRVVFSVLVTNDVRPDTLFAPFHWGGKQAANILTNPALDPTSRMPEFKVCAVRVVSQHPTGGDRG